MLLDETARKQFYSNRMSRLSKRIKYHDYIGFDVETYGDTNIFYSGGLYWFDRGQIRFDYFKDKEKMIKFMLARKFRNKYIVATNLDFDFTTLVYNTPYWNKFNILSRDGKIIQATYDLRNNNGKIRFIDTCNYVFFSVEKLGQIIKEEKMKKPDWLGDRRPETVEEDIYLFEYNRQDCKITKKFMDFFQEGVNNLGGTVKLTIASTALHTWRMNYQPCDMIKESYITKDDDIKNFIFSGYYGGRTEVFKRGIFENVNYYDVNSLYPFVMCKEFPLPQSVKKIKDYDLSIENIVYYEGVSECEVICPNIDKPILPFRINDKLTFPVGKFKGTWNNCELRLALELGYELKPIKQIIYTKMFKPFDVFVEEFYNLRMEYKREGSPFEIVVKLILNSLYGKFGTKKTDYFKIIDMTNDYTEMKDEIGDNKFDIKDGKLIIRGEKEFNGIYSFPIIASYVTSYARIHMYEFLKNKNVIYTDTDSIITTDTYNTGTELGALKLEGMYETSVFVKPKFYRIDKTVKIKGINRANTIDFEDILHGKGVTKMKFSKLRESARRGISPNTKTFILKNMNLIDNKRTWEHDDLNRIALSVPLVVV